MNSLISSSLLVVSTFGTAAAMIVISPSQCIAQSGTKSERDNTPLDSARSQTNRHQQSPYIIEPPDILVIDCPRVVPKPPYHLEPLDVLLIQGQNLLPTEPVQGLYSIEPEGTINLGPTYGSVYVEGMTVEEAKKAIEKQLAEIVTKPRCYVALAQTQARQQIRGEHLVRPDGTVGLGTYGSVHVEGRSLAQAKKAIEEHLSKSLRKAEVSVDVRAYNSKFYYILVEGDDSKDRISRHPVTGKETVLDALSNAPGLPRLSSRTISLVRPAADAHGASKVLAVDWTAITQGSSMATNHRVYTGDLLIVGAKRGSGREKAREKGDAAR